MRTLRFASTAACVAVAAFLAGCTTYTTTAVPVATVTPVPAYPTVVYPGAVYVR